MERFFFDIVANDLDTHSRTLNLLDYERAENTCTFTANLRDAVGPCNGFVGIYDQQTGALVEETDRYGVGDDGTQEWQVPPGTYTVKHVYDESSPHYCTITRGIELSGAGRVLLLDRAGLGEGETSACATPLQVLERLRALEAVEQVHHEVVFHFPSGRERRYRPAFYVCWPRK